MSTLKLKQTWQKLALVGLGSALLGVVMLMLWMKQRPDTVPVQVPDKQTEQVSPMVQPSTPANEEALREAALEGLVQKVQSLLVQGTDLNAADENGRTALMLAAFNGHTSAVQVLVDQVVDQRVPSM